MRNRASIKVKLAIAFIFIVSLQIILVGTRFYNSGREALTAASEHTLTTQSIEKKAALLYWTEEKKSDLEALAGSDMLSEHLASYHVRATTNPNPQEHEAITRFLSNWVGEDKSLLSLFILDSTSGQVILSTAPEDVDTFRENRPYFIQGRKKVSIQNPQISIKTQMPEMFVSAPVRAENGELLGVLVGKLNMAEVREIVQRQSGLRKTMDSYLVNTSHLFVTQPLFLENSAELRVGVYTSAVNSCLKRTSGVTTSNDYREIPAIISYRWIPELDLCLIIKLEQEEAYSPIRSMLLNMILFGGVILMGSVLAAYWVASTITRPLDQLMIGAKQIGAGRLDFRIQPKSEDELGKLANAFNKMAEDLQNSIGQTIHNQRMLLAVSQAAQAVQRARTPEAIYQILGEEAQKLGYQAAVLSKQNESPFLKMEYLQANPEINKNLEQLADTKAPFLQFACAPGSPLESVMKNHQTLFLENFSDAVIGLSSSDENLQASNAGESLHNQSGIIAPLNISEDRQGVLAVFGSGLTAEDAHAIVTFANQTSIALENARITYELRRHHEQLEIQVQERTSQLSLANQQLQQEIIFRQKAEEELQKQKNIFLTVLDNFPELMYVVDPKSSQVLFANKKFVEMLETDPIGQPCYQVFQGFEKPCEFCTNAIIFANKGVPYTWEHHNPVLNRDYLITDVAIEWPDGRDVRFESAIDITKRKIAEKARIASEERYRVLAETSPEMIFVIDQDDHIQYVNSRAAGMFGTTPEEVTGKPRANLFPPRVTEAQSESIRRVLETGESILKESPIPFPTGTVWLETNLVPIRNSKGIINAVMGVSRDITERMTAQQTLQDAEVRYRTIFEESPEGILLFDAETGTPVEFNDTACRQLGYTREEFARLKITDYEVKDSPEKIKVRLNDVLQTGRVDFETVHRTKQGQIRNILISDKNITLSGKLYIQTIYRDITEIKQAQEELFQSRQMLQLVFDNIPQRVFWKDRHLNYLGCNKPFAMDTNLSDPLDIIGMNDHQMTWAGVADLYQADDRLVMESDTPKINYEEPQSSPGGKTHWLRTNKIPLHDAGGNVIGVLGTYEDITESKRAEEEIRKKSEELKRSNEELERFAYVASHDLQEPLRMVTSYLQLLERRYKDRLDGDAIEFIAYAVDGANRMKNLISDLLSYSRVGTRGKELSITDCNEVLTRVLSTLQFAIADEDARVEYDSLPTVMADRIQLEQVFQNLIGNALKFRSERPPEIHIRVTLVDNFWQFSIQDNGIGMEPQYFERIFIVFQRLHNREDYQGTGIGLAITKRIIERHGGKIWVNSQPGNGSTFFFTLPAMKG